MFLIILSFAKNSVLLAKFRTFICFTGTLACPHCNRRFVGGHALGQHFKSRADCNEAWKARAGPSHQHRASMTIAQKCSILEKLVELEKDGTPLAQSVICVHVHDLLNCVLVGFMFVLSL